MAGHTFGIILLAIITQASSNADKRPQFTTQPPSRILWPATRGAHASCRASGHPPPEIHWVTAEGQLLTTIPGLRHVLSDGRLVFGSRRSLVDAGGSGSAAVLRCRASNRAGTVLSRPVLLQPVDDNILTHTARQLMPAKLGGSVVLRCEVSPLVGVVEVSWLQDGLPLASVYSGDSRWILGANGFLLGSGLTQVDIQAEYACIALDTASPPIKLTTDDSSWLENVELNSVEARVGNAVVLPCVLKYNTALSVVWQRQDPTGTWVSTTEGSVRGSSLFLPSVRLEHAGRYACSASSETASKAFVRLAVYEPLSVTVEPNPLLVGTGGTGQFNCSVTGGRGTGVSFSWQHEGRPLHPPQSTLSIGSVRPHHAGLYQCTAYDHSETTVGNAELIIADRPPRLLSSFNEATARIGQTVVLRCSATGVPSPRIYWTLEERPLPSAPEKYSVNTRAESIPGVDEVTIVSTLTIAVRASDDGGRYSCNATNTQGSQVHHARLNVFGPPNIRYLSAVHVKTDTDVTIYCPYSGYPIKEVLWRRGDGTLVEPSIEPGDDRGILKLPAIRSSLAGSYTCEVKGESGELARRSVKIEVHKIPKLVPFQFPEELEVGDSTQATCSLVSGDKPIQFTWQKDNLPIPSMFKVEQKNMDFFSFIIIQHLSSAHSGEYTCKATNEFGSATHTASLIVKEAPSWIWRAVNTSVSAGAALLLPCSAKGQPAPRITWEFSTDGENWRHVLWSQSENSDMTGGSILADGTVWLKSTTPEHEGWYRCSARVQHAFLNHVFYLDVREPPRLSRAGDGGELRWVVRGSTARLTCIVRGEPEVHVHWTHDSRPLAMHGSGGVETRDISNGVITSQLSIVHTGPEHAGEYRCVARNLYGSGELGYKLFVKERPSTPEEVTVSEVWPRKARISWRVSRGALVSHYSLQYKAVSRDLSAALDAAPPLLDHWDSPEYFNVTITSSEVLHAASEGPGRAGASISGLSPDTRYALRLAAFNDVGGSSYTSPLHFTTREEAPGGAPRDVTVRALRPHELHVSWQPPLRETWHGTLLGYTIRWWEVTDGVAAPGSESGAGADAASATLRALKPATRYAVTVRAYNAAGAGPPTPPRYAHTMDSPPTAGPESLTCVAASSTSLKVTWRPPPAEARGGLITHYTLQYTRRDGDPLLPVQDHHLRLQGEEAIVSRLSSYAEYEIRVRAHNAAGDGPLSAPQVCRTDEDVPEAAGGMKLIALSERSLRASWLPPPQPNGRLTHYSLHIRDLSSSGEANVTRVSVCTESEGTVECMRSVRGLRPGRTYEAWVRAATAIGEGPPSATATAQTTALAPARISSFGGVVVGTAGAALTLRCVVGGVPPPAKRWMLGARPLLPRPPAHLDGEALVFTKLEVSQAGNYTCVAENPHGADSVTWQVVVLRAPPPPTLALLQAAPRQLSLELRPAAPAPGHAVAKAFTVHWRLAASEGEWRSQGAHAGPLTLSGLRCGSLYRAYGAAGGPPGPELAVSTVGGPPTAPHDNRWIVVNASHARFDTSQWGDGGCGRATLKLEWGGAGVAQSRDLPTGGSVVAGGLTPGSRYRVVATAINEAGQTREVYEFSTIPAEGSFSEEVDAMFPATSGELALLLTLCAALSLAALTILAILLRRKRSDMGAGRVVTHAEKLGRGTYRAPAMLAAKLPDPPDEYEISPYATFAEVGGGARAYTLQLRSLAMQEDDAAPGHEETCVDACDAQRRRRRRQRHYCADHGYSQDSGS